MEYRCECGKIYTNCQAFNGHKSHCLVHLGKDEYDKRKEQQVKNLHINDGIRKTLAEQHRTDLQKIWDSEKHYCEHCGKEYTEKFGSGRFCCSGCAHAYSHTSHNKQPRYCKQCGKEIQNNRRSEYCCNECKELHVHYDHYIKYLNDNLIAYGIQNMQNYKKFFLEEQDHRCAICGCLDEWCEKQLVFILDHVDGNADNNTRDNLRLICPNCDSQLDTFKSKNKNSARAKYRKVISKDKYDELTKNIEPV